MSLTSTPNEILLEIASYLPVSALNCLLRTSPHLSRLLAHLLLRHATTPAHEIPALFAALTTSSRPLLAHILTHAFPPQTATSPAQQYAQVLTFTIHTATGRTTRTHSPPAPPSRALLALLTEHGATTTVHANDTVATAATWAIYHRLASAHSLIPRAHPTPEAQLDFTYLNAAPTRVARQPALHIACARNPAVVRALLRAGAAMSARDGRAYTPLHTAASLGVLRAVQHLLGAGADPDGWHDGRVWSPLALAAWYAHPDVVAALLDGGADVNRVLRTRTPGAATGAEGWNVLHRLVARMSVAGAGEIWRDAGEQAMREAWSVAWEDMFRMLMRRGADPTAPDGKGRSARVLAERYGMDEVVAVLGEVWPWEKVGRDWWCAGGWEKVTGTEVGRGAVGEVMTEKAWRRTRREEREKLQRAE